MTHPLKTATTVRRRRKSINDIESQRLRILRATADDAVSGRTPHDVARNRYVRAAVAANRYVNNIALTDSYQNTATGRGGEAKANARKYSQSTYMGLRSANGGKG